MPTANEIVKSMSHRDINIQRKGIADAIDSISTALFEGATGTITDNDYKAAYENLSNIRSKILNLLDGIKKNPVYVSDLNYRPRQIAHKIEEGYKLREATRPLTNEERMDPNFEREYVICKDCGAAIKNTPSAIYAHHQRPICIKNRHKINAVKKQVKNESNALISFNKTAQSSYLLSKYFNSVNMCGSGQTHASNYMITGYEEFCINYIKSRFKGYMTRKYFKHIKEVNGLNLSPAESVKIIKKKYKRIKRYLAGTSSASNESMIATHIYE